MRPYALTNCVLHTGEQDLVDHALLIEGDRILDILPSWDLPDSFSVIDLQGDHISPGFVDLQLNGCGGVMFNDEITAKTLEIMHTTNLKSGTTSYLPTLITTSDTDMLRAMELVRDYRKFRPHNVLGLHLEGPYLNPKRKGIHNERYIRRPEPAMIQQIAAAGRSSVLLLTLAPEIVEMNDILTLADAGILVSAGHSDATYEQAIAGFDAGVGMVTHLFNAMSPWLGRSPGLVGAAFDRDDVYAGIIADGHHTHLRSIALAHRMKGEKLLIVTDATPPVGTQMDSFRIGGQVVFYREGKCVSAEGTLGGSALTMIEAIRNCVSIGLPLAEALRMASAYPAAAIAVNDRLGYLAPGYVANLAIFNDALEITGVCDRGEYLAVMS
ncbi:N-acetylglucosamine-6-phosphate deacetylase [Thermoleptolyngbya sp. C42_A2020_037]|uniref:N-acetylglucosamine-6-phosphate deacetylase n=1 Tax=Thermoleptolyngbya sp. C42_A2020_037 TaxID=2747799 RepID=UPI001A0290BB|nr:N-acetylglucosamine-6-phosphate deacetylase [Thermoleptolyngbya sp. C42_A2020_037]MBF2083777.1 N-acetylglucosamine-6-phosphate deacetylase [Thermoleptolyngbya sp. C42_A2020_037]